MRSNFCDTNISNNSNSLETHQQHNLIYKHKETNIHNASVSYNRKHLPIINHLRILERIQNIATNKNKTKQKNQCYY